MTIDSPLTPLTTMHLIQQWIIACDPQSSGSPLAPGAPGIPPIQTRTGQLCYVQLSGILKQFEDDSAHTILLDSGKPAVELSFRFEIPIEVSGQRAMLCGHLDRLVEFNSQIWAMDHKTTKYSLSNDWFGLFNPDNQMTLYTLASQVVYEQPVKGVIISGAQILATLTRFSVASQRATERNLMSG